MIKILIYFDIYSYLRKIYKKKEKKEKYIYIYGSNNKIFLDYLTIGDSTFEDKINSRH